MANQYNSIDYTGKNVVINGAASGMGKCVKELIQDLGGANIYAVDLKEIVDPNIKKYIPINLLDPASIDAAVAELPDRVDYVFNTAAVAGEVYAGGTFTPAQVITINFVAIRRFVEGIIPKMPEGSGIVLTASIAGNAWPTHVETYMPLVQMSDWDDSVKYIDANVNDPTWMGNAKMNKAYTVSKECMIIYAKYRCAKLSEKKIRLNVLSPGGVSTPMHDDFNTAMGMKRGDVLQVMGIGRDATGEEMASAMLFLNSPLADYISGVDLQGDYGFMASKMTGQI